MNHYNLIKLVDAFATPRGDIYLVTEAMVRSSFPLPSSSPSPHNHCNIPLPSFKDCDLARIISPNFDLIAEHVQYIMYGILRGLKYLHSAGKKKLLLPAHFPNIPLPKFSSDVLHRDLKPSNIFINSALDVRLKQTSCYGSPSSSFPHRLASVISD